VLGVGALREIDVLWVYNSPATVALPMWLAKARFRAPIVLHNMDMWPDSVIHTGFAPSWGTTTAIRGMEWWVGSMYRSAAIVAYITPSAGRELAKRGVPSEKLRYAPVWINEDVFRPTTAEALRASLGFRDDDVVVGYAGALGKAQGVTRLVEAVLAQPTESNVRCLVLGSGTEEARIENLARQHPDRVIFRGYVPQAEMTLYAAVPDICYVGLAGQSDALFAAPSKVLAIMAAARPILAAADGDTADLIRQSGAGVLVPQADVRSLEDTVAHVMLMGRPQLATMGQHARSEYLARFSANASIDRIVEVLQGAHRP
jgi:glycosyltransferase involved in cell wall biosynthesis